MGGTEFFEDTLIVSLGSVPSRAHEYHTLLNGLTYCLGDWSILKNWLIEKSDVIHDDLRPSRREFPDSSHEIQTGWKAGAEEQVSPGRHVVDNFCQRPALTNGVRIRAAILAIDDG